MFSLPIHEEPEVVYEQIINLKKYNPNCAVIIHINPVFKYSLQTKDFSELIRNLNRFDNVYINPQRLSVGFNDIIQAHISNYEAVKNVNYDYFYFIASNELFLKKGAEEFVSGYEYGCQNKLNEDWAHIDSLKSDEDLKKIMNECSISQYSYSQVEGSFYSKAIMGEICNIIKKNFDYKAITVKYPREEVYFPTIANALFSDIKHYEECCCRIRWEAGVLFTSIRAVNKIAKNSDDPHFSVKRVDRKLDDYLRCYIRDYIGKYRADEMKYMKMPIKKCSLTEVYIKNTYFLVVYFFRRRIALLYHKLTKTHAN